MDKRRRHFRHAVIRAEEASRVIPIVGQNSYVSLFSEGVDTVALFDFKTSIHPDMHDYLLPGLSDAKHDFQRAWEEVIVREGDKSIRFGHLDQYSDEESHLALPDNVVSLNHIQREALKGKAPKNGDFPQIGKVTIVRDQIGIIDELPIRDITSFVRDLTGDEKDIKMLFNHDTWVSINEGMNRNNITFVAGPSRLGIINALEKNAHNKLGKRAGIDYTKPRDLSHITQPNL